MIKNLNLKKILRYVCQFLWYLMVVLLALILIQVSAAKLQHKVPSIAGYSIFRITTGSMEPTIPTGTYILTRKTPADLIGEGDIITFYSEDPAIAGMPNTHRVMQVVEGDTRNFVTRGDANHIDDKLPVDQSQVIGRYVCSLERLTAFVNFFLQKSVLILLLLLQGVCLVLAAGMAKRLRHKEKKEPEALPEITPEQEEEIEKIMERMRQEAENQ